MKPPSLPFLLSLKGPLAAGELRTRLGISAATLSRLVAAEGEAIHRLGRGRATRYALARELEGLPRRVPIYRVDSKGRVTPVAEILPLVGGSTWVQHVRGEGHLHAGLPPVLVDMAPAGYLGRRYSDHFPELGLPPRLLDWSDNHRLIALGRRGEDVPGDLVLGEESLDRFLSSPTREAKERDYPALEEASARGLVGLSAGGEQPKFTAVHRGRHVLVKFTAGDDSPSDVRWRDLLGTEAIALKLLAEEDIAAAGTRIIDIGAQRFLEVERFDRVGLRGRRGVLSLGPIDDDIFGGRDTWTEATARFETEGVLPAADARRARLQEAFGMWICNGDRHSGNLSFFADGLQARPLLQLAPAYGTLPMDAAPRAGLVPELSLQLPAPKANLLDVWDEARRLASAFWSLVADDKRISVAFRRQATKRLAEQRKTR